jgi:lipopolysaccharide export system permease protein
VKLLDRYLGRVVVAGTLLALCILVSVDAFVDFIDEMEDVEAHGYTIWRAAYKILLTLPQGSYEFFPTAALLGGLLGLGNLAAHNELVALRAAGVSIARIIGSVLKTGVVMMLVAIFIGEVVAPVTQQWAQNVRRGAQTANTSLITEEGLWAKDGERFININQILPGLRLGDVRVYVVDERQRLVESTFASSAVFRNGRWVLQNVRRSRVSHARVVTESKPREIWPRLLAPELFRVIAVEPEYMSAWRLARYIAYLKQNHLAAERYELAFWTRFTTPLSSLVMLLLATPFVFGSLRTGGAGQRLFIGILIGLAFHLFNRAFNHLALVYGLDPWLGAVLPLCVFLVIGVAAIARMR